MEESKNRVQKAQATSLALMIGAFHRGSMEGLGEWVRRCLPQV